MEKRFDELFRDIADILRRDWAGIDILGNRLDLRYYNTAVGQAWHDRRLDELTFLRYTNEMLAATGDRHLTLALRPSERYTPWCCGFFTRRYGDSLYVTDLRGDARLTPGDRITAVNGASPSRHRAVIQKNFFYADDPEREDWNGLLKMADYIDAEHADGSCEQLPLERHSLAPVRKTPELHALPNGRIVDLRNVADVSDDELMDLLPRICRGPARLSDLTDTEFFVNYTRRNCLVKAAGLQGIDGAEGYIAELREKSGQGFLPETDRDDAVIDGHAPERVIVLTDTWTRDGAETLALAAKRAGATLLGRATLGTIDLGGDVSLALDDRYTLTWSTLITKSAAEGRTLPGRGIEPDIYIPWTPAECREDILLREAMERLEKM